MIGVGKGGGSNSAKPGELSPETIRAFVALYGDDLDRALLSFAEKRGIVVAGAQWKEHLLIAAGMEHPELKKAALGKKRRKLKPSTRFGRPRKVGNRLLAVAVSPDPEAVDLLDELISQNEANKAAGRAVISDKQFAEMKVTKRNKHSGEQAFVSAVGMLRNRLSSARQVTGRPLKSRKKTK